MEIRRAYRERIYPTKGQAARLLWTLEQCRTLYNTAIEQRRHVWESWLTGQHLVPVPDKPEGRRRRTPRPATPAQQKRWERTRAKGTAIHDGLMRRTGVTYDEQLHDLLDLKAGFPEFAGVDSQVLQNVCKRVDLAYAAYFDRRAEHGKHYAARKARGEKLEPPPDRPRFRSKRSYSSITNQNPYQGWKLEHGGRGPFPVRPPDEPRIPRSTARRQLNVTYGRLLLHHIGALKVRWSRPIEGTVKTITIRREGPEWYVVFSCVLEIERPTQPQRPAKALDVGLVSYATFEDGSHIENPRYYRKNEAVLARRQRTVCTKVEAHKAETATGKGSSLAAEPLRSRSGQLTGARRTNNLARARGQVAKAHRKARRRREYFHHVEAKKLIARAGAIAVEELSISSMVRRPKPKIDDVLTAAQGRPVYGPNGAAAKSGLNKSINDAAWGAWLLVLQDKAMRAGVHFVKVSAAGTSQICSGCGRKVPKTRDEYWHHCPHCDLSIHRDHNAARVIYQRAGFETSYGPLPPTEGGGLHNRARRARVRKGRIPLGGTSARVPARHAQPGITRVCKGSKESQENAG